LKRARHQTWVWSPRSACAAHREIAEGCSTLEELQAHYTGSDNSMDPLNYVWFQYRWQRLAAKMFEAEGEDGLVHFWDCFYATDRVTGREATAISLVPPLAAEVSQVLGRALRNWRETQSLPSRTSSGGQRKAGARFGSGQMEEAASVLDLARAATEALHY
jgi:hypothetical protein